MSVKRFLDTNVLIYAFAQTDARSQIAEALIADGGIVSVQVMNEFVNVCLRKLSLHWDTIDARLEVLEDLLEAPVPLTMQDHVSALDLAKGHKLSFYDALIVASATAAGVEELLSEDFQHGRKFGTLTVQNPFLTSP